MGFEKITTDPGVIAAQKAVEVVKKEVRAAKEGLAKAGETLKNEAVDMAETVGRHVDAMVNATSDLAKSGVKDIKKGAGKIGNSTPIKLGTGLAQEGGAIFIAPFKGDKALAEKLAKKGIDNISGSFGKDALGNTVVGPYDVVKGSGKVAVSWAPALVAYPVGALELALGESVVTLANTPELAGKMAKLIGKELKLTAAEIKVVAKEMEVMLRNVLAEAKTETMEIGAAVKGLAEKFPFYTTVGLLAALGYGVKKAYDAAQ